MSAISYVWCLDCEEPHEFGAHTKAKQQMPEPIHIEHEATPLQESLIDAQRIAGLMVEQVQELAKRVEALQARCATLQQQNDDFVRLPAMWQQEHLVWRNERTHIVAVLSAFARAPISLSSLQPVLTLAQELGCALRSDE